MISTALTAERCVYNEKYADQIPPIFRWSNAKDCNIKEYGKCSAVHIDRIHISDSCTCTNSNCSNRQHISDIDNLFDDICNALRVSSLETITTCKQTLCQDYIVPGWNVYVKEAHTEARYYYILWRDMGKHKHGPVCELMRKTRLYFKYLLKQCQQREDMPRADAMAKSMQAKDADSFWKNVSKTYTKGIPNATNVNGANDPTAISAMWKTHFESLLNNVTTDANMQHVKECIQNTEYLCYGNNLLVTPCMVQNAIDKWKSGKACGNNDGLSAENFILSDRRIIILLSIFYNRVISHGYLPDDFMRTVIIPLIKKISLETRAT